MTDKICAPVVRISFWHSSFHIFFDYAQCCCQLSWLQALTLYNIRLCHVCLSAFLWINKLNFCLYNALHGSIGQNIKSHTVSGVRSPAIVWKTSNSRNSATLHPIYFVFGSRLGFLARIALFNLTAHELHELYYDNPTS